MKSSPKTRRQRVDKAKRRVDRLVVRPRISFSDRVLDEAFVAVITGQGDLETLP